MRDSFARQNRPHGFRLSAEELRVRTRASARLEEDVLRCLAQVSLAASQSRDGEMETAASVGQLMALVLALTDENAPTRGCGPMALEREE